MDIHINIYIYNHYEYLLKDTTTCLDLLDGGLEHEFFRGVETTNQYMHRGYLLQYQWKCILI